MADTGISAKETFPLSPHTPVKWAYPWGMGGEILGKSLPEARWVGLASGDWLLKYLQHSNIVPSQVRWTGLLHPDWLLGYLRISLVNGSSISDYLLRYPDLTPVLLDIADEVRRTLADTPLALEMVYDPDEPGAETLVLYVQPPFVEASLFQNLDRWNQAIAQRMASSEAWFIVNIDLRS